MGGAGVVIIPSRMVASEDPAEVVSHQFLTLAGSLAIGDDKAKWPGTVGHKPDRGIRARNMYPFALRST